MYLCLLNCHKLCYSTYFPFFYYVCAIITVYFLPSFCGTYYFSSPSPQDNCTIFSLALEYHCTENQIEKLTLIQNMWCRNRLTSTFGILYNSSNFNTTRSKIKMTILGNRCWPPFFKKLGYLSQKKENNQNSRGITTNLQLGRQNVSFSRTSSVHGHSAAHFWRDLWSLQRKQLLDSKLYTSLLLFWGGFFQFPTLGDILFVSQCCNVKTEEFEKMRVYILI